MPHAPGPPVQFVGCVAQPVGPATPTRHRTRVLGLRRGSCLGKFMFQWIFTIIINESFRRRFQPRSIGDVAFVCVCRMIQHELPKHCKRFRDKF